MASTFRMANRLLFLRPVMDALAANPEFVNASQKAIKAWSDGQKDPDKRITPVDGVYPDHVLRLLKDPSTYGQLHGYVKCFKAPMYLLRLMDSGGPCIGKVYYACCLVDKYLRVCISMTAVPYAQQVYDIFMKRWRRWHRPIHTLAYALDPSYHEHVLNSDELKDITISLKKWRPKDWTTHKVQLTAWRQTKSHTEAAIWDEVDKCHGWQWWQNFGENWQLVQGLGMKLLSKGASASATEWCWSDVGHVLHKKRQRVHGSTLDKQICVRAMHRLEKSILGAGAMLTPLPTLDVFLDELIMEVQNEAQLMGLGDTVGDDVEAADDEYHELGSSDEDDEGHEDYEGDVEELYDLPSRNVALEAAMEAIVSD